MRKILGVRGQSPCQPVPASKLLSETGRPLIMRASAEIMR